MTPPSPRGTTLPREFWSALKAVALPALIVGAGMVLLGLLVTHVLQDGWLGHEATINRVLAAHRTAGLNTATHVLTWFAETPTIIGLTVVAGFGLRLAFGRWHESVFVALCVAGESLIFLVTSLLVDRQRPPVSHLDDAPPTSSFPSGHTAAAIAFYGALALVMVWHRRHALLRAATVALAVLVPLVVGGSRLYRGMHFLSDVIAGMLLGITWLTLVARLVLVRERFERLRPSRERYGSVALRRGAL